MIQQATSHAKVCVRRLLSVMSNGATIFTGADEQDRAVRVVAPPRVLGRVPVVGESWLIEGEFRQHATFGSQLHATGGRHELPRGRLLTRFLAEHPDFVGIGAVKAKRLWDEFGDRLHLVLSEGLREPFAAILSPPVVEQLLEAWAQKRQEAKTIDFLDAHGFEWTLAAKLRRVWGAKVLDVLQGNPYQLLAFASWPVVDAAARKLGIELDDDRRLVGAVEACLYHRLLSGHTATPPAELGDRLAGLVGRRLIGRALDLAVAEGAASKTHDGRLQPFGAWALEQGIARRVRAMLGGEQSSQDLLFPVDLPAGWGDADILRAEVHHQLTMNAEQRAAVVQPFEHHFCLLTGGAGVGKTTVLRVVLDLAQKQHLSVVQMALAGRAAQRMAQATGQPAITIAKFLSATRSGKLEVPPDCLVIVDEASMLDLPTLYRILMQLPDGARLMLVGDPAQLPPIGFGLAFHRLVEDPKVPQVHLRTVHRQVASSGIPAVAAAVRSHCVPEFVPFEGRHAGVSFIDCTDDDVMPVLRRISVEWVGEDWQVLAAVKGGKSGIRMINGSFHAQANSGAQDAFAIGEPVIHLINDYERSLMNGALGRITAIDQDGALHIDFDGEVQRLPAGDVPGRIELAYAISVHKAQGSQFKRVVVVICKSRLLDHSLIYTALTRGVEQVVFLGARAPFELAVLSPPFAQRRDVAFTL
jgi:exodeoxyribonuclease V alpha subunit